MCGIVGILDPRRSRSSGETAALLASMAGPLLPRGPDGEGVWVDEGVGIGFGHRRLSILDLSEHGAQPMRSADGRFVITYNGEIYNHRSLTAELGRLGAEFVGHSDTEVLVEAIARWGLGGALERVDGMFAFGLWDRERRELSLVRDRMGEKPLYYGQVASGEVVFASTLDAIRLHPHFRQEIDRDALALYFRHKYVPAPWSIYRGIAKVESGCRVTIRLGGEVGPSVPYWSLLEVAEHGVTFTGDPREAVDELDRLLREAVGNTLVADVPVGAFLSGGVDSSTTVAVAQQVSGVPVRTFTIGSTDAGFDESAEARKVAAHLGTDHTELIVDDEDARNLVSSLGEVYDEPFADSSQIPTLLVSGLARRHVTVAVSGDGGDELFGGYNRYLWVPAIWRRLARVPAPARRLAAVPAQRVPPAWWDVAAGAIPARRRPRQLGLKVSKVLDVAGLERPEDVYLRLVTHWPEPARLVRGSAEPSTRHTDRSRWPRTSGIVEHMMVLDAVTYLPDDILAKVDRAAMSVSLETRVPMLSRQVVEFALGLPLEVRIRDGVGKWPLRQVLGRYVPPGLVDRPKAGFGLPIEHWLRGPLREWAEDHLFGPASRGYLDGEMVRGAWEAHLSGRRNLAYELWDVLMFSAWCETRGVTR